MEQVYKSFSAVSGLQQFHGRDWLWCVTSARTSAACYVLHKIGVTFLELGTLGTCRVCLSHVTVKVQMSVISWTWYRLGLVGHMEASISKSTVHIFFAKHPSAQWGPHCAAGPAVWVEHVLYMYCPQNGERSRSKNLAEVELRINSRIPPL